MKVIVGTDIVYIPDFKKGVDSGGVNFLTKVFTENELKDNRLEHLAGLFAAKEASIKALSLKVGSWKEMEIEKKAERPTIKFLNQKVLAAQDLTISHAGDYAIAVYVGIT